MEEEDVVITFKGRRGSIGKEGGEERREVQKGRMKRSQYHNKGRRQI